MGKRIVFLAIIAAMVFGSVLLFRDFRTTASGCLYYLGKGIYTRDADLFLHYFDFDKVISEFKPNMPQNNHPLAQLTNNALVNLDTHGAEYLRKILEDNNRPNLPGSLALLLSAHQGREENGRIEVMLPPLSLGSRPLRFSLALYPDNTWKVVEINQEDLQWLLLAYLGIN